MGVTDHRLAGGGREMGLVSFSFPVLSISHNDRAGAQAAANPGLYAHAPARLGFVADWLQAHRQDNGLWDMGPAVKDRLYFPLSDSWKSKRTRELDCTERIGRLVGKLTRRDP